MPTFPKLSLAFEGCFKKCFKKGFSSKSSASSSTEKLLSSTADQFKSSEAQRLNELMQLKPPTMSKMERFFSWLRGTGDKIDVPGNIKLGNFGKVDETVFRGAMPTSGKQFEKLKNHYDIHTIIDLRGAKSTPENALQFEKEWAAHHEMKHIHIPMDSHQPPSQEELTTFFQAIEDAKGKGGIYVHCKHGVDRTGSMIAAYQTKLGLPKTNIYQQMKKYGYNLLHQVTRPGQRKFVHSSEFSALVKSAEAKVIPATG